MKDFKFLFSLLLFFCLSIGFSQERKASKKVKISGKVIDKANKQPLEYTTITLQNTAKPSDVTGGITNNKGEFSFDVNAGIYDIKIEFIS